MVAGGGPGILGGHQYALALSERADEGDDSASFPAAGFRENFHNVLLTVLPARGVAGLGALQSPKATGSSTP